MASVNRRKAALLVRALDVEPHRVGRWLKRELWRPDAVALLPGSYGWNDGGCLLLADALARVFGSAVDRYAVLRDGSRLGQHFLVGTRCDEARRLYVDADGVSKTSALQKRWREEELVAGARVVPFDTAVTVYHGTPRDAAVSRGIARHLVERWSETGG